MSRWFRHYAGLMRDDKLVRVAIRSKQTIERVCWVWGAILESAAEIDSNGKYDLDPSEVAYFLRADQADVDAILDALSDAKRVAKGRVVKWSNRQFSSDRSKERVAAHRERKRKEANTGNRERETGNVDVTLQASYGNSPELELETETELEEEGSEAKASGVEPPADPIKQVFDLGVAILTSTGKTEKNARSLIGKWRQAKGEAEVLTALLDCQARRVSEPVEWLEARFRTSRYVSPTGYEYRGGDDAVMREAEKRADWGTYWKAKGNMDGERATASGR